MAVTYHQNADAVNWETLKADLIADDFHNGRTTEQLEVSFRNSQLQAYAMEDGRCIGTARGLSDGIGNAYVVDVWTHSGRRLQGIGRELMEILIKACPGQHIYLQTDEAVTFYRNLGFIEQPTGMSLVNGQYLQNKTRR